jgi:hypothetical protein
MRLLLWLSIVTYFLINFISKADFNSSDESRAEHKKAPPPSLNENNTSETDSWITFVNPILQQSYNDYIKQKKQKEEFQEEIKHYATLTKSELNLAIMIHRFNLRGDDFDPSIYDECTHWMQIYEKETIIARENYDGAAYVFFFEEFVKLTFKRAGIKVTDKL